MKKKPDVTTEGVVKIFFKYTIPTIIGMFAISSASITDGIFVGRFIGPDALAVINLIIPFVSLLLGIIIFFNLSLGGIIALSLRLFDTMWIRIFFKDGGGHAGELATLYISVIWIAFFINGINIVFSGYFTSIQKPVQSLIVSILRSLVLPVVLILFLSYFFNDETIFFSIPIAEAVTLFVTLILFKKLRVFELVPG